MNNSTYFTCSSLQGSILFGFESIVLLGLTVGSLSSNYIFLKVLLSCGGHLPLNTKLLLINCTAAAIGKSAYFLLRVVYNFCLIIFGFDEIEFGRPACIIVELPYAVCTIALILSMLYIGLERLRATYMKNLGAVETSGSRMIVAQISIWAISLAVYLTSVLIDSNLAPPRICYCYFPMIRAPSGGIITNVVFVSTQTINIIIYVFVYWQNKRILFEFTLNTARHTLTDRFVMWTNIKATRMLLPDSIMHALVYDFATLFLMLMSRYYGGTVTDNYVNLIAGVHCLVCLDTLLHPIMCLRYNYSLRDLAQSAYPNITSLCLCKFRRANTVEQNDIHRRDEKLGSTSKIEDRTGGAAKTTTRVVAIDAKKIKISGAADSHHLPKAKAIVEYRLKPDEHKDILLQMWDLNAKQNSTFNKSCGSK